MHVREDQRLSAMQRLDELLRRTTSPERWEQLQRDRELVRAGKYTEMKQQERRRHLATPEAVGDRWCDTCHGAGWQSAGLVNNVMEMTPCPDCADLDIKRRRHDKLLGASGLADLQAHTFEHWTTHEAQEEQWALGRDWAATGSPPFLWLFGAKWAGKTTLAVCIGNLWLARGKAVHFRNVPELLNDLKASFDDRAGQNGTFWDRMKALQSVDLLILDDYGKESPTAWAAEQLFVLTDYRLTRDLPTILTTEWSLEELRSRNERLYLRVMDQTKALRVKFTVRTFRR